MRVRDMTLFGRGIALHARDLGEEGRGALLLHDEQRLRQRASAVGLRSLDVGCRRTSPFLPDAQM